MKGNKLLTNFFAVFMLLGLVGCSRSAATNSEQKPEPSGETTEPEQSENTGGEGEGNTGGEGEGTTPEIDYGQLSIEDIEVTFMSEMIINPVFSIEEYEEDIEYTFEGNNIQISEGKVKGLVANSQTEVTATTEHHETTFTVKVLYAQATLTHDEGNESKYAAPVPESDKYVIHFDVQAEEYISQYTRLSSFAFNGSDNSWYNIEMGGDGNINLFAKFNGIEKYWIFLGNKSALLNEGKIEYHVDIKRDGQASYFYFNEKLVCGFSAEEMNGYATLGALEVTAAADRDGRGKYVINLNNIYFDLGDSQEYADCGFEAEYPETILQTNGEEAKFSYGNVGVMSESMVYSTTVDVETWSTNRTRPLALAFNGSDNSWYNIEMGDDGSLHLFARFNGVEKYWIFLGKKDSMMVEDKIHFTVTLLKQGQATFFFFNGQLKAWFTEKELAGYAKLETLEASAATGFWGAQPFKVIYTNTKIEDSESETFINHMNLVYRDYPDATLKADNGAEQRAPEIAVTDKMLFTCTVKVIQDSTGWFRPSAFAFNNSDNSWYNIETDNGGSMTLYARFNGVEKYGIPLGTKADTTKDDAFAYDIAIVKDGQATYFFYNGVLKAQFSVEELGNYPGLFALNITSSADRAGSAFETQILNQKVQTCESEDYQTYMALISQ